MTAEDGQTTKSYTITVNKLDTVDVPSEAETGAETEAVGTTPVVTNGLDVEIDGVSYTVATEFDAPCFRKDIRSLPVLMAVQRSSVEMAMT